MQSYEDNLENATYRLISLYPQIFSSGSTFKYLLKGIGFLIRLS